MSRRPAPHPDLLLAAVPDSPADARYAYDLEVARLITDLQAKGATWAMIGCALGGLTGTEAKRVHRALARRVGRAWRLQDNAGGLRSEP